MAPRNSAEAEVLHGSASLTGKRKNWEDRAATEQVLTAGGLRLTLAVVADGMGGPAAGEVAADLAISTVLASCQSNPETDIIVVLRQAVEQANQEIDRYKQSHPERVAMGTTLAVAAIDDRQKQLYVANVGDSRIYLIRNGRAVQITLDHTLATKMLRAGRAPEYVANNPNRNKITRYIGEKETVDVDLGLYLRPDVPEAEALSRQGLPLETNDRVLVCSDGIVKDVAPTGLPAVRETDLALWARALPPKAAADRLADIAIKRGSTDNVSVALLDLGGRRIPAFPLNLDRRWLLAAGALASVFVAIFVVAAAVVSFNAPTAAATPLALPASPTVPPLEQDFAYVSDMRGEVLADPPGEAPPYALEVGSKVRAGTGLGTGYIIRVNGPGWLRLGLADGSLVFLDGNTEIELSQIASAQANETLLQISVGTVLVSADITADQRFFVFAQTGAQAQVAGSLMCIRYEASQKFDVDCLEGHCRLIGRNGGIQDLNAGQHSFLYGSGKPASPDSAQVEACLDIGDPGLVPSATPTVTNPPPTPTATPVTPTPTREVVQPTRVPPTLPPVATATPAPTDTNTPGNSGGPSDPPTNTPSPTASNTPLPTATHAPSQTATPTPRKQPRPTSPVPPTAVPTTPVPPTAVPTTPVPPTAVPTTPVPPTAVPTTPVPPTAVPTTPVPPTAVPPTDEP